METEAPMRMTVRDNPAKHRFEAVADDEIVGFAQYRLGRIPDETFPTMADIREQVVVAHTAYHAGQLAVWRRAMGKEPAAVFV